LARQSERHEGEHAAHDRGDPVTNRTDAALTRRVIGARLAVASAVLGGTFALAGLGAFGDLSGGGSPSQVGGGLVTVELSEAVGAR
jgi:hypothetical protein